MIRLHDSTTLQCRVPAALESEGCHCKTEWLFARCVYLRIYCRFCLLWLYSHPVLSQARFRIVLLMALVPETRQGMVADNGITQVTVTS